MKLKNKIYKRTTVLSIISCFLLLCTGGIVTFTAYLNDREAQLSGNINSDLSKAFGGGNGTNATPYQISSITHLENLRRLTNLGVFSDTTYFKMTADIDGTSSNRTLAPIGTYNTPFISKFDGNGKTIRNLNISSYGYDDVGIFGYVGCGGVVRNFFVDNINVVSDINSYPDEDYLGSRFTSDSALYSQTASSDITIDTTNLRLSFASKTITDSRNRQYPVSYRINDSLYFDRVNNYANLKTNATGVNNVFYTSIDALIYDTFFDETTGQVLYCSYVVQRYLVYLQVKNNALTFYGNVMDPENETTSYAAEPQFVIDSNGNQTGNHYYQETDNSGNVTLTVADVGYVGMVIGNLDGDASYIGVKNSSLTVNTREQVSFFTIVGRTPSENKVLSDANGIYYQELDFADFCGSNGSLCTSNDGVTQAATTLANDVNNVNNRTNDSISFINNSSTVTDGIQDNSAFKFFGNMTLRTNSNVVVPINQEDLEMIGEYKEDGSLITYDDISYSLDNPITNMPSMVVSNDMNVRVTGTRSWATDYTYGVEIQNGIFVWASYAIGSISNLINFIQNIFGWNRENTPITFRMEMYYSVSDCNAAIANNAHFMIQRNDMQINNPKFDISELFGKYYLGVTDYYMQYADTFEDVYYTDTDGNKTSINSRDSYADINKYVANKLRINTASTNYPITYVPKYTVCPSNTSTDMSNKLMRFSYELNDVFQPAKNTGLTNTPFYTIGFQNLKGPLSATYTSSNPSSNGITNDDGDTTNNVDISIYSVRIEITSSSGNSGNNLSKVDYVYDDTSTLNYVENISDPSWDSGTWNWTMLDTRVYLSFKVIKYDPNDTSSLATGIKIKVVRAPKSTGWLSGRNENVTVTWTGASSYAPTDSANVATINQG